MNLAKPGAGERLPSRFMLGQGGIGDEQINAQVATVLHEHMAAVAEPGRLAVTFPYELRLGIDGVPVNDPRKAK